MGSGRYYGDALALWQHIHEKKKKEKKKDGLKENHKSN